MAFNIEVSTQPATRGDVGGIAIQTTVALQAIAAELQRLSDGDASKTKETIELIKQQVDRLSAKFDTLVGWTDD